ncbi:hypothetical protein QBC42DRAFT_286973 [Cladorrhinum samala]|uniref:Uncharacterized protein n=1 Tax=Cladorrhinum samala TaxID=585594 RepID=A0AAV9HSK5_9PEZI|nr:hypothetical protein QBC42DRAFT_286973 [Cladorrhinum samala]
MGKKDNTTLLPLSVPREQSDSDQPQSSSSASGPSSSESPHGKEKKLRRKDIKKKAQEDMETAAQMRRYSRDTNMRNPTGGAPKLPDASNTSSSRSPTSSKPSNSITTTNTNNNTTTPSRPHVQGPSPPPQKEQPKNKIPQNPSFPTVP